MGKRPPFWARASWNRNDGQCDAPKASKHAAGDWSWIVDRMARILIDRRPCGTRLSLLENLLATLLFYPSCEEGIPIPVRPLHPPFEKISASLLPPTLCGTRDDDPCSCRDRLDSTDVRLRVGARVAGPVGFLGRSGNSRGEVQILGQVSWTDQSTSGAKHAKHAGVGGRP